jgi:anti-sigma B factor antagonist
MNFEVKQHNGITVFRLNEKRLDTSISGLVKGEFTILVKTQGVDKLVVDMSQVESCDSSGLSSILVANRLIHSINGQMRIAAPSEKVLSLIKITQLDRVLPVCSTVDEAYEQLSRE